jgi:hydrogenase maturation protein HypF
MLPYTPLHHLLMRDLARPIVLTSGNRSDEPQCIENEDARRRLKGIADHWLMHDRAIVNRLDDSVARVVGGTSVLLRRARGHAPEPIRLPEGFAGAPRVLAMGAELKSTFCLVRRGEAILSQHIGDLEEAATHADYRGALGLYRRLFAFTPDIVAVDRHPDYLSTQWGRALAAEEGVRLVEVQHHHAHIAACLAEHGVSLSTRPVLGIVLDGLGLGENGELWGGEFLLADYLRFERLAAFASVPLIGGARAMREPWRNTFANMSQFIGWTEVVRRYPDVKIVRRLAAKPVGQLQRMLEQGVNVPPSSSAGRLFDAVAAALCVLRRRPTRGRRPSSSKRWPKARSTWRVTAIPATSRAARRSASAGRRCGRLSLTILSSAPRARSSPRAFTKGSSQRCAGLHAISPRAMGRVRQCFRVACFRTGFCSRASLKNCARLGSRS